jgi:ribosome-associated heat shock protein Hsp15
MVNKNPKSDRAPAKLRLDVWLWRARLFKTRALAAAAVEAGAVWVMRAGQSRVAERPGMTIAVGDGVTVRRRVGAGFVLDTVRVAGLGVRRGPPLEARTLYEPIAPDPP